MIRLGVSAAAALGRPRTKRLAVIALVLCSAFAFQGSRGLWEPDEGNYGNVAYEMAVGGDWILPHLNGGVFLDKPPLSYWTMALGVRLLGVGEWGFRFGHGLLFALTACLVGAAAATAFGSRAGWWAGAAYATTVLPFLAGNVLTPDTPLAFGLTLALFGYLRADAAASRASRFVGWLVCGLGFGLAILAKGPAALPFAAPIALHRAWTGRIRETLRDLGAWSGAGLALLAGGSWYWLVLTSEPGAGAYLLDNQVVGRLFSDHLGRNPGWSGLWRIYGPTIALGFLPWGLLAMPRIARLAKSLWREPLGGARRDSHVLLLALWITLPGAVFLAAQSRLPLYLLPLAAPVAAIAGHEIVVRLAAGGRCGSKGACVRVASVAWVALIGAKLALSGVVTDRDSRAVAAELRSPDLAGVTQVVALDVKRNALPIYSAVPYEEVTSAVDPYPYYAPLETFEFEATEMHDQPAWRLVLVRRRWLGAAHDMFASRGIECRERDLSPLQPALLCGPLVAAAAGP